MIKVETMSFGFPQKDLYDKVTFTLEEGQHCAFIGVCGTGKSTLIDMLINQDKYMYTGKINIEQPCRIGYVSQFPMLEGDTTISLYDYLAKEFVTLNNEIAQVCKKLETAEEFEELLEQYQQLLDKFQAMDGDNYESNIDKMLYMVSLMEQKELAVSKLSGGEFKLIQIVKEMLNMPNLLVMDEPDVFLDFEHLESLRKLINSHQGTILVITHNRFLLNHCFNKILHLENKELQEFDGGYIDYNFSLLMTKIETQELAVADEEEIERNMKVVNQFQINATKNSNASFGRALKGRKKILERLQARKIKQPFVEIKEPDIQFHTSCPLDEEIMVSVKDYSVSFKDLLLENVDFEITSGEKIAIIGANGTGKSTLLRDIYKIAIRNTLSNKSNSNHNDNNTQAITINENTTIGLLSQNQGETLNDDNTILDEFMELGFETYSQVEEFLLEYGFDEDVLNCKIGTLSGGERNLLQIAKISKGDANLLLLDEPTSHLDTYSQLALENAITNYNGTIIMISHDFYSIANCVDYILYIENKTIRKMSMRAFRKMIYAKHFSKDYLEFEQKKKQLETKISYALQETDFETAQKIAEEYEELIKNLN